MKSVHIVTVTCVMLAFSSVASEYAPHLTNSVMPVSAHGYVDTGAGLTGVGWWEGAAGIRIAEGALSNGLAVGTWRLWYSKTNEAALVSFSPDGFPVEVCSWRRSGVQRQAYHSEGTKTSRVLRDAEGAIALEEDCDYRLRKESIRIALGKAPTRTFIGVAVSPERVEVDEDGQTIALYADPLEYLHSPDALHRLGWVTSVDLKAYTNRLSTGIERESIESDLGLLFAASPLGGPSEGLYVWVGGSRQFARAETVDSGPPVPVFWSSYRQFCSQVVGVIELRICFDFYFHRALSWELVVDTGDDSGRIGKKIRNVDREPCLSCPPQ